MKVFVCDVSICNGCYCCQVACKDEHVGNDWSPYAKPQPETGQFWVKLTEHIRGTVPKVKMHYIPLLCNHCDDAPCLAACPVSEAIYKREDGLVIINPEKCTGCGECAGACPYDAIYLNDSFKVAQKCTGCAHLLDDGWQEPRCVEACPTGSLRFMDEDEAKALFGNAQALHPEYKTKPRVYYMNIPGKFIAGTVYDPVEKEVIIGATCTLRGRGGERVVATDGFGDFWFEGLESGVFSLTIEKDGKSKVMSYLNTEQDLNLGDIPLA